MAERLSGEFRRLAAVCAGGSPTFRTLLPLMSPRDHALLTLFLAACFMHPVPMPGISWVLGALIAIAGSRMAAGKDPWIPKRWIDRPLPARALERIFSGSASVATRLEKFVRPRGRGVVGHAWARIATGAAMAACGVLIVVPLPPPTNFPPATALLLLSLGVLEEDGVVWGIGWLFFALNLAFFAAIFFLGWSGVKSLLA